MDKQKKLFPAKYENAIYYGYNATDDMKKYAKTFDMKRELFSKNKNFKKYEEVKETKTAKGTTFFPRYLGEAISKIYNVPIRKYKFEYKIMEEINKGPFLTNPRTGQNEVFLGVVDQLTQTSGITLKLNTGQGKTWIVSKVIWHFWQNTIIFVQNKELQHQMCTEIEQHTGITWICKIGGDAKTKDKKQLAEFLGVMPNPGRQSEGVKPNPGQPHEEPVSNYVDHNLRSSESHPGFGITPPFIGVAVYKTAYNLYQEHGPGLWDRFYLAVYDECHCYCNPTGIPLLKCCNTPMKFALSATPDDGWNTKLVQLWCGMLYDGDAVMPKKNIQGKVKIIKYYGPKYLSESQKDSHGTNNFIDTLRVIEQDEYRKQMGIKEVFDLYEKDMYPLVFFQHVDYMQSVKRSFEEKYSLEVGMLFSDTPKQDREEIKMNAKIIFTTYKFGYVGLNIPNVKSVVFFEPHKTLGKQVNGRALRDVSETTRIYVDIVDMVSFLGGQLRARMIDYDARGFFTDTVIVKVPDEKKN